MGDRSFVFWYSSLDHHLCGYCKSERGNISHGMWAQCLTVEEYQNLIDRGWRRSGHYCYKPLMNEICCPMYTIKCDVLNFQLSKSQKKVIKKFNKYLRDGNLNVPVSDDDHFHDDGVPNFIYREAPSHLLEKEQNSENIDDLENNTTGAVVDLVEKSDESACTSQPEPESGVSSQVASDKPDEAKVEPKSGVGADPNKPPCKKAKVLRMERKQEKLMKRGMSLEKLPQKNEQKSLEEFLNESCQEQKHKIKLELVNASRCDEEWDRLKNIEFELYKKYQMTIHNDPPGKNTMESFLRFLVKSPLKHVKFSRESDLGFGSFHQLYWLDDKLIAVGVIDILPKCVSAVYFFYDPDYRNLTLGTYGSLREVEFARSLHNKVPSIENYYMGYYIHSCQKMRYKGKLTPSFLLCPETYHWVPIEKCLVKLDVTKYARLVDDESLVDENKCTRQDVDDLKILYNGKIILFKQFKRKFDRGDQFDTIGQLIGKNCARTLIFVNDYY